MKEPTEKLLVSISELEGDHHWEEVKRWFTDSLHEAFENAAHRQNEAANYAYNAGWVAEVYERYNTITKTRDTLTKMRSGKERRSGATQFSDGTYSWLQVAFQ